MKITKKKITPVCPHCEEKLTELILVVGGWFDVNRVYCCPHCKKIVGMSAGVT